MFQVSLSMVVHLGFPFRTFIRFINEVFFTYWLNGVTSGG